MKHINIIFLSIIITVSGSGCSTWRKLDNTEKGAVIGGGTGAAVGSAVSPGIGGAVVGGALGAVGGGLIGNETKKRRRN